MLSNSGNLHDLKATKSQKNILIFVQIIYSSLSIQARFHSSQNERIGLNNTYLISARFFDF